MTLMSPSIFINEYEYENENCHSEPYLAPQRQTALAVRSRISIRPSLIPPQKRST